jgi:hypothetical protein
MKILSPAVKRGVTTLPCPAHCHKGGLTRAAPIRSRSIARAVISDTSRLTAVSTISVPVRQIHFVSTTSGAAAVGKKPEVLQSLVTPLPRPSLSPPETQSPRHSLDQSAAEVASNLRPRCGVHSLPGRVTHGPRAFAVFSVNSRRQGSTPDPSLDEQHSFGEGTRLQSIYFPYAADGSIPSTLAIESAAEIQEERRQSC